MTAKDLDKIICAKIHDKFVTIKSKDGNEWKNQKNPLYDSVKTFMLHGPSYSNWSYAKDRSCNYTIPKDFKSKIEMSEDKYPL